MINSSWFKGVLTAALILFGLTACAQQQAPSARAGAAAGSTPIAVAPTAADGKIEIGVLVVCSTTVTDEKYRGRHPDTYMVEIWSQREKYPPCPVQADLVMYDYDGAPRPAFADRAPGSMRVVRVPQNMITTTSLLCVEVHGVPFVHAPKTERKRVGNVDLYVTCSMRFPQSVIAGKSTGRPGDGFRIGGFADYREARR